LDASDLTIHSFDFFGFNFVTYSVCVAWISCCQQICDASLLFFAAVVYSVLFCLTDLSLCLFECCLAFEKGGGDQEIVSLPGEMSNAVAEVDVQRGLAHDTLAYILFLSGLAKLLGAWALRFLFHLIGCILRRP
jgi:hypothetical protein